MEDIIQALQLMLRGVGEQMEEQPSTNTSGTITSTVQANQGGFSIVTYTGTGTNATVGHGLSQAPEYMIIKNRDSTDNWICLQ